MRLRILGWVNLAVLFSLALSWSGLAGGHGPLIPRIVNAVLLAAPLGILYFVLFPKLARTQVFTRYVPKFIFGFLLAAPLLLGLQVIVCHTSAWGFYLVTLLCAWPVFHGFRNKVWRLRLKAPSARAPMDAPCLPRS